MVCPFQDHNPRAVLSRVTPPRVRFPGRNSSRGHTGDASGSLSLSRSVAIFLSLSLLGLACAAGPKALVTLICAVLVIVLLGGGLFAVLMGLHLPDDKGGEGDL